MRQNLVTVTGLAVLFLLSSASAFAQGGGAGQGNDVAGAGMMRQRQNSTGGEHGGVTPDVMPNETPAQILTRNKKLSSTVQEMLPSGTDAQKAADGYDSLVKFVSAVHASKNLGIPFSDLKAKMTKGDKLEKAIKALKPDANAKEETKKAEKQAKSDIKDAKA